MNISLFRYLNLARLLLLSFSAWSSPLRADDLRIGLIGLDTSHVVVYLKLFNEPDAKDHVTGGRITGAFQGGSKDIVASASRLEGFTKIAVDQYGVKLYDSIEELAASVDALMILSVDGRPHLEQFRRTLKAGKPVFIDKPLAASLKDAFEIVRLSRESGTPCFSSSSLRYTPDSPVSDLARIGEITASYSYGPAEREPHHPDLFWYGIHTVEALYSVMSTGCVSVVRTTTQDTDVVTGTWDDGRVGTVQGNRNGYKGYGTIVLGRKGVASGGENQSYVPLAQEVIKFFETRTAPVSLETTLEILTFMEAADESKRRAGSPVKLSDVRPPLAN